MELRESETVKNLMRLFAGETMARARYEYAAAGARTQGAPALERVFLYTAGQEREHARILWDLLKTAGIGEVEAPGSYPVDLGGDLQSLLDQAAAYEFKEADAVYPAFADTAQKEGFVSIAQRLRNFGEIERLHGERFSRIGEMMREGSLWREDADTVWLYISYLRGKLSSVGSCAVINGEKGGAYKWAEG